MLLRLLLFFTVVPLVELTLLILLAQRISLPLTILLVLLTGVVGAALARHEGLRCLKRVQQELAAGELPADPLIDGLMILLAGALLVTPGVLTDVAGLALLVPVFRRLVRRWLKRRFRARIAVWSGERGWRHPTEPPPGHDKIIDVRVIDPPPKESKGDQ